MLRCAVAARTLRDARRGPAASRRMHALRRHLRIGPAAGAGVLAKLLTAWSGDW
jgi:hypothetical protein